MEEDQENLTFEDSNQLALKDLLLKADEVESGSSSNEKKKETEESKDSKDSSESLQKEDERPKSKTPPPPARSSPEPSCAICLEQLQNKSFPDACFHFFCFTCLVEWSKVKPECPLCKQSFKSIVHNVRSLKDFDLYHINKSRLSENFWTCVGERRFRYSTTLTPDRLFSSRQTDYSDRIESAIASHRMRYAPHSVHSVRTYASSQSVRRVPCTFRRNIYEENLWVRPLVSNRVRNISPSFFRQNIACTHRLLPWLNRELLVVMPNNESQISFVIELIMALIVKYEITSQEFYTHIEPYTSSHTAHFIHEFYNFAVSPYESLESYDMYAQYSTLSFPVIQSVSSPDSDVIPLTSHESSSQRTTGSEPKRKKQHHSSKKKHSKEYRKLKKLILKRNSENNCWESVPAVPFMSYNSVPGNYPFVVPGPSTSRDISFPECSTETPNEELDESNDVECLGGVDDEECQVVEVLKPKRERTPEIVDLSSDEGEGKENAKVTVVNEFSDDTDISSSVEICTSTYINVTPPLSPENISDDDDDDDIVFVSETKVASKVVDVRDKPIDYSLKSLEKKPEDSSKKDKKEDVQPCSSNSKHSEQDTSQPKNAHVQNLLDEDTGSRSLSPIVVRPKKRRAVVFDDSSTESCSETTQVSELNTRIKKLKLRSVVAHYSVSDEHNDSTHHSSAHKKHKDKKKKKKKHKHRRHHIYSSESN